MSGLFVEPAGPFHAREALLGPGDASIAGLVVAEMCLDSNTSHLGSTARTLVLSVGFAIIGASVFVVHSRTAVVVKSLLDVSLALAMNWLVGSVWRKF